MHAAQHQRPEQGQRPCWDIRLLLLSEQLSCKAIACGDVNSFFSQSHARRSMFTEGLLLLHLAALAADMLLCADSHCRHGGGGVAELVARV